MPFPLRQNLISRVYYFGITHTNEGRKNRGGKNLTIAKIYKRHIQFFWTLQIVIKILSNLSIKLQLHSFGYYKQLQDPVKLLSKGLTRFAKLK